MDVFSDQPLLGNPVAVVATADGLTGDEMQQFTRWMNLSESTFLLPPVSNEADYKVRIFTLEREMPFAGHPTLGTCHAWLRFGGMPRRENRIVQECGAGLVTVRRNPERLSFAAPPLVKGGPVDERDLEAALRALRIGQDEIVDAQWVDNGPGWIAVLLKDASAVLELNPVSSSATRFDIGVVGAYPPNGEFAYELRAFFTDHRGVVREDPVTGSLNASVAQWLLATERGSAPYVASQGQCLGRAGRIHIDEDADGTVWVGGNTTTIVHGEIDI